MAAMRADDQGGRVWVYDKRILGAYTSVGSDHVAVRYPSFIGENAGLRSILIGVDEYGGFVSVSALRKEGTSKARLGVDGQGGRVDVFGKDGTLLAALGTDEQAGYVTAHGKDGKSRVTLKNMEYGGGVVAFDKGGEVRATLGIIKDGGFVQVKGKGEGKVVMLIDDYGNGVVATLDKNGDQQ